MVKRSSENLNDSLNITQPVKGKSGTSLGSETRYELPSHWTRAGFHTWGHDSFVSREDANRLLPKSSLNNFRNWKRKRKSGTGRKTAEGIFLKFEKINGFEAVELKIISNFLKNFLHDSSRQLSSLYISDWLKFQIFSFLTRWTDHDLLSILKWKST